MFSMILAAVITLSSGYNNPGASGEVLAVKASTAAAATNVVVSTVDSFTVYTNKTVQTISYETAWHVVYTNFDGNAAVSTNVIGYLDYSAFMTNGTLKIVGDPVRYDQPITNQVVVGLLPKATYVKTNELDTVTVSGHFGTATPSNKVLFGEAIIVEGAADGDSVQILIK